MTRLWTLILLFLVPAIAYAKHTTGRVVDSDIKPIEYATIVAFNDTVACGGCLTDNNGIFQLETSDDAKSIRISFIGYKTLQLNIPEDNNNLGDIIIELSDKSLSEITITTPAITREPDRFILNIENDPTAKGKNMQQIIQSAPGVWLDRWSLSIFGKSGTQVYINERRVKMSGQQLYQYLQMLQSSTISTVEIIPTAGPEYSASFDGGIIKIILKKQRTNGFFGNIGINFNAGKYLFSANPNGIINYHHKKLTINIQAVANESPYSKSYGNIYSFNSGINQAIDSKYNNRNHSFAPKLVTSAILDISPRQILGLEAEYSSTAAHTRTHSASTLSQNEYTSSTIGKYSISSDSYSVDTRVNYTYYFSDKKAYLKFIGGYSFQKLNSDENNSFCENNRDSIYCTSTSTKYKTINAELRYYKPINKSGYIFCGIKYSHNGISNVDFHHYFDDGIWHDNKEYNYDTFYSENILGIFASLSYKFGAFGIKPGARGEFYKRSGELLTTRENDIYPTISMSYNLSQKGDYSIGATFSRRVKRPTFWSQSPLIRQYSDYTYTVGNPNLKSSNNNSININAVLANKFTIGTSYAVTDNAIRQMFTKNQDFPERLYLTYGNIGSEKNIRIYIDSRFRITSMLTLSAYFVYTHQRQNELSTKSRYNIFQSRISYSLILPHSFSISMLMYYYTPMIIGNIKTSPFADLSLTINKSIGKKWNIALSNNNLLQLNDINTINLDNIVRKTKSKSHTTATLSITYSFSSGEKFKTKKVENNLDATRLIKD